MKALVFLEVTFDLNPANDYPLAISSWQEAAEDDAANLTVAADGDLFEPLMTVTKVEVVGDKPFKRPLGGQHE